jgi:hypothetical protein
MVLGCPSNLAGGRLVAEPDFQLAGMRFADEPPSSLERAFADASIHRQAVLEFRQRHRRAPAGIVRDYRVGESGIEHSGFHGGSEP